MDTATTDTITQAQSPEVFDVLSFLEDTAYPTQKVTVFREVSAAKEYKRLVEERALSELPNAPSDTSSMNTDERDKLIEELGEKIASSAIIFELRGMPPGIVNDILMPPKDAEDVHAGADERDDELIARSIVKVTNYKGVEDNRHWKREDISRLRRVLVEGEFQKLINGVAEVNFNAAVFDQATDAGFPGRSIDVA